MTEDNGVVDERRSARFLLALLTFLGIAGALIVWPFLAGTLFALVLGFLLQRPYNAILRVVRWRPLAAGLMLLVVLAVIVVPIVFVALKLIQDVSGLLQAVQDGGGFEASFIATMRRLGVSPESATEILSQALSRAGGIAQGIVLSSLGPIASAAANLGVFFFLLYFMLTQGPELLAFVKRAMPLASDRCDHLFVTIGGAVRALFLGTFLVALIQGGIATLGWWFFGLPGVVFWGFVMTMLAVIPAIGPILVMLPAGILLILQGNTFAGVGIILYGLLVVGFVDNLTRPFIVGRSSDIHPGIVLLGTVGGLAVLGISGFIIGPLILSLIKPVLVEWESLRAGPG